MSDRVAVTSATTIAARAGRVKLALARVLHGIGSGIGQSVEIIMSRQRLLDMDDRMLKDLGLSRAQAEFEASRAPWQGRPADRHHHED